MPNFLFDITITIYQRTKTAETPYGAPTYTRSVRYADVPARLEENSTLGFKTEYNKQGQRDVEETIIYIPSDYPLVEIQDEVVKDDVVIGLVRDFYKAYAPQNGTSHYEIILEKP